MIIHFERASVARLLAHSRAAPSHEPSYAERYANIRPTAGLWLVGDQGVYLMSNGRPALPMDGAHALYAIEIDPTKVSFDEWWAAKRAAFGGDDGVEALRADFIDNWLALHGGRMIPLDLTPRGIAVPVQRRINQGRTLCRT